LMQLPTEQQSFTTVPRPMIFHFQPEPTRG
jgi:hypothetical protein